MYSTCPFFRPSVRFFLFFTKQEAQLSQRDHVMLRVTE